MGIDIERRIDRREPTTTREFGEAPPFGDLITLHRQDPREVAKDAGRSSKSASIALPDKKPEHLPLSEFDRDRIKFGKERALEGAGLVTTGSDLEYQIHSIPRCRGDGVVLSTEAIDLAWIAVGRVGNGKESDLPTQDALDRIVSPSESNIRQQIRLVVPSAAGRHFVACAGIAASATRSSGERMPSSRASSLSRPIVQCGRNCRRLCK
jgi:hypothetical protein